MAGLSKDPALDGPWTALLYRAPTFAFGPTHAKNTPGRVELMCGLGMRPRELKGLPTRGMKLWKSPGWAILCAELGEVRRPALTAEVAVEDIRRGAAEAQGAVDEAAQTPEWRRFLTGAEWGEHDLEVQLYVRLG